MSKDKNVASRVRSLIEGPITEAGYLLWDVEFAKEGPDDTLFVIIDKAGGIDLDDCTAVTHLIDPILDEADPIPTSYYLEVSSAGAERVLKTAAHFEAMLGERVVASLYAPLDGAKEVEGTLDAYSETSVTVGGVVLEKGTYSVVRTLDTTGITE
ncbi:MAG: ribosome maturation factor RimP [Clostridia bacterium]|nr:ribosome maturation factor RimP [Clostridia bacterium]